MQIGPKQKEQDPKGLDMLYLCSNFINQKYYSSGREEEIKEGREIGSVLQRFSGVKQELPVSICFFARKVG